MNAYQLITGLLLSSATLMAQVSFWPTSIVPSVPASSVSATVGLKFYTDVPGSVTAIRFYKGTANTGTHTGTLYTLNGQKLAEVVFTNETASGWQQAKFSSPVSLQANVQYAIAYTASKGSYALTKSYSWSSLSAGPLHPAGGAPAIYHDGRTGLLTSDNYWVDLVFVPTATSTPKYTLSGKVSGTTATITLSGTSSASTTTDASGNFSFSGLVNGSYVVAPGRSGYTFSPSTKLVTINGASISGVTFTGTAAPVPTPTPTPVPRAVTLSWNSSTSLNIKGYNVYRATVAGGPYTKLTASPVAATVYVDSNVVAGQSYFYVATTVNTSDAESSYSSQTSVAVPAL